MSSDKFDNKIKDSLENGSPDFEESSWHKMEAMLDKHMPQKKDDRRKLILFFFLFLLLGGGTTIIINRNTAKKDANPVTNRSATINNSTKIESLKTVEKNEKAGSISPLSDKKNNTPYSIVNNPENIKKSFISGNKTSLITTNSKPVTLEKKINSKKETDPSSINTDQEKIIADSKSSVGENTLTNQQEPSKTTEDLKPENENIEAETKKEKEELLEKNIPQETNPKSVKKKQPFLNNILMNVSVGPDLSSVGNNTGKVKMMLGAGLGFKISERLSIRSGLFIGRKIYTADPEDYNPPSNFWSYYPNLKSIDADCKVLDIPINLDYKFGLTKTHNWFVSAGASSFFMKKEVYNFYYKPANSQQYVYYTRKFENENKHYFSILNLSGGFSKKISPALTIQAEPYMKIAMKGVGYGKVKLNSAGFVMTASFQPFQSKK